MDSWGNAVFINLDMAFLFEHWRLPPAVNTALPLTVQCLFEVNDTYTCTFEQHCKNKCYANKEVYSTSRSQL